MGRFMVRAVLFDLGDTLFDLRTDDPRRYMIQGIELAYRFLVESGFNPRPFDKYLPTLSKAIRNAYVWSQLTLREVRLIDLIRRTHRKLGIELDEPTAVRFAHRCHAPIRQVWSATPGARETLLKVRAAGYLVGLVSNTFMIRQALEGDLEAAGMLDLFDVRVWSCEVGYAKPHPIIFRVALDTLGVRAEETIFIGDLIEVDVKGAARMGMRTVLKVPDGRLPPGRCRPDHVIRKITEVPALLGPCPAG